MAGADRIHPDEQIVPIVPLDRKMELVHHFLESSVRRLPGKVALIQGSQRIGYADLNERANAFAHYLLSSGVRPGDRVPLLMENCPEYVASYYGAMKAGAVVAPLNTNMKPEGLKYALVDLGATVLVSSSRFEKTLQDSGLYESGVSRFVIKSPRSFEAPPGSALTTFDDIWADQPRSNPDAAVNTDALASIIYTSGSTGGPKGVMLSHRNIVDNTFSICQYLGLTENDIQMCVLPFFYVMGKSLLNTHIAVGGTIIINNQFAFPAAVLKEMIAEGATGFSGVPSTFAYLLHRSPLAASRDKLTSLRYVSQAGGHMARAIKEELRRVLPLHTDIVVMYGATEASARLSYLAPSRLADKMESIGKAIPGVRLRVVKEDGSDAANGEVGELIASGSNVMQGYWNDEEATKKVLSGGWYRTGDQAYVDEEGFFFVVGRKDDLVKVGGHRLSPQEIEDALMESNMFVEVAVLGLPDALLGNKLVVLGVPVNDTCTPSAMLTYCAQKLPRHKVPTSIRLVKALPKSGSGKVDRKGCVSMFLEQEAGK
jgi:acyl-CoA synthetase (AMP-forming)/AMP-acid ligase II